MTSSQLSKSTVFDIREGMVQDSLLTIPRSAFTVRASFPHPVARVRFVGVLPHLDKEYDYLIPEKYADVPVGARIKAVLGRERHDGFIVERRDDSPYPQLRSLDKVVSPLPVLRPDIYGLALRLAAIYCASVGDILRFAIPTRHAGLEKAYEVTPTRTARNWTPSPSWEHYQAGSDFIRHLRSGTPVRAALIPLPGDDPALDAAMASLEAGHSALVITPSNREAHATVTRWRALHPELPLRVYTSQLAAPERYGVFLDCLLGQPHIVIGTRAAAYLPFNRPVTFILTDDRHPLYEEPRQPYINVRDVILERLADPQHAFLAVSPYRSVEIQAAIDHPGPAGRIVDLPPAHPSLMRDYPRILTPSQWGRGETSPYPDRIPDAAFALVRDALATGKVLISVPRTGWASGVACSACRELLACRQCGGTVGMDPGGFAVCERCHASVIACPACGGRRLRAVRIGSRRTARDIGRAFTGVSLHISSAEDDIQAVYDGDAQIVIATPGAEPIVDGGYAAAVILEPHVAEQIAESHVDFARFLTRISSRVRSGGVVLLAEEMAQAELYRRHQWREIAVDELALREELRQPPFYTWVEMSGRPADLRELLGLIRDRMPEDEPNPHGSTSLDVLLAGGVTTVIPGMTLLGPSPGRKEGEQIVVARYVSAKHSEFAPRISQAYHRYLSEKRGESIRIEVCPRV